LCKRTFSDAPGRGHDERFKTLVLAVYEKRMSMRGVARTFKVSRNTLVKWLKEKGAACPT